MGVFVAGLAGLMGLLTQPWPASLRVVQMPLVWAFEDLLDKFQFDGHIEWMSQLEGAFMPVESSHDVKLTAVRGQLPGNFSGLYLRVGPMITKIPASKRTHVFDGDGMVYSVRIQDGEATMHNSYLETPRYKVEKQFGHEWFMRVGELHGWLGMLKLFTTMPKKSEMAGVDKLDAGTGNTAVGITPEGKMWALNEVGRPFQFSVQPDGSIESLGMDYMHGTLRSAVSAHPKYDYRTGETFYHGKDLMKRFYAGRIKDGRVVEEADLPVGIGFQHDMFITTDYVIIIDGSSRFHPESVAKGQPLWQFDAQHMLRFGVAPRNKPITTESFTWLEAPYAAEIVHTCFGWNEGSTIKVLTPMAVHDASQTGGVLAGMTGFHVKVVSLDLATAKVTIDDVEGGDEFSTEFCRVRDDRVGQRTRYAFSGVQGSRDDEGIAGFNFTAVLKWDIHTRKRVGHIPFPLGRVGGEPIFIPHGSGDDDGYLGMFWWDLMTKTSSFVLLDAKTFAREPVVELLVPSPLRVPLGFHGWWLSEAELQKHQAVTLE
eukprot:NODE_256_length_1737_cov_514.834126.p1 GENE.NODE_256_length_1737_cov_514.834126~~NODE_256_length_1737_cov_514.834126.p1  ORF type:complete len:541 (-),score=125.14 NODE_256_length_1737_cov_514.834126:97-1719(-)